MEVFQRPAKQIVVIGATAAGITAARAACAREAGADGTSIAKEGGLPNGRPSLSKRLMAGKRSVELL
ncbi:FAD-dependent oxidoreductase [Cupriavidus necator]|uniref:FAD-dependent oxidoreductase n=1 Tax=Burkholderiaceae TaxID=119060 RepID=UPI0034E885DD